MRVVDLIRHKRDGGALDRADIEAFVTGGDGRIAARLPDGRAADGDLHPGHDAEETAALTDAMVRSGVRVSYPGRGRRAGRQAQHRRRRRQDVADPRAARRGLRRGGADDVGPRARAHRRDARQARGDSRIPHRPVARRAAPRGRDDRLRDDRPDLRDRARRPASSTPCGTSPARSRASRSSPRRS